MERKLIGFAAGWTETPKREAKESCCDNYLAVAITDLAWAITDLAVAIIDLAWAIPGLAWAIIDLAWAIMGLAVAITMHMVGVSKFTGRV